MFQISPGRALTAVRGSTRAKQAGLAFGAEFALQYIIARGFVDGFLSVVSGL